MQVCLTLYQIYILLEMRLWSLVHLQVVITNKPDANLCMCSLLSQRWLRSRHVRVQILLCYGFISITQFLMRTRLSLCDPFHFHIFDVLSPHHFLLLLGHHLLFVLFCYVNSILSK